MTRNDMAPSEMFESLTGFDEIAIKRAFGASISDFAQKDKNGRAVDPFTFGRALVFVALRREGQKDAEAYKAAMSMTIGDSQGFFRDEPEDGDLNDDEDAEGKDETPTS